MNVERIASPSTLVAIDDMLPCHAARAERRRTRVWTGDLWRLHRTLAESRPDLVLLPLDTSPTGMLLVAGLDPSSRERWDGYSPIVSTFRETPGPPDYVLARSDSILPSHPVVEKELALLRNLRVSSRDGARKSLRALLLAEGVCS